VNIEEKVLQQSVSLVLGVAHDDVETEHMVELNYTHTDSLDLLSFEQEGFELTVFEDLNEEGVGEGPGLSNVVPIVAEEGGVVVVPQRLQSLTTT
jgi:hypothetical protein